MLGVTTLFGFCLYGKVASDLHVHDHEGIVWAEVLCMWVTLWLVPEDWSWLLLGFLMFRRFDGSTVRRFDDSTIRRVDIFKPWPIRWIDRHVHGGVGIVLDDVLAGVFAWLAMQLAVWRWANELASNLGF